MQLVRNLVHIVEVTAEIPEPPYILSGTGFYLRGIPSFHPQVVGTAASILVHFCGCIRDALPPVELPMKRSVFESRVANANSLFCETELPLLLSRLAFGLGMHSHTPKIALSTDYWEATIMAILKQPYTPYDNRAHMWGSDGSLFRQIFKPRCAKTVATAAVCTAHHTATTELID